MGRKEHCKQTSLVCVGSARSVWATLGLPPLTACVLSQSTLLRLWVALHRNCLKWALGCMHFPGLNCSCHPRAPRDVRSSKTQGCTFLPRVCLNRHGDTVLSPVCELQSLQQELHFRVAVGTDHVEGISRLVGKICFLEKNRHEIKKCHMS